MNLEKKGIIFYGTNYIPPVEKIKFYPDGSFDCSISGVKKIEFKAEEDINWFSLFELYLYKHKLVSLEEIYKLQGEIEEKYNLQSKYYIEESDRVNIYEFEEDFYISSGLLTVYHHFCERLLNRFKDYCNPNSKTEKNFLELYFNLCCASGDLGFNLPALIPNVFVNWGSSHEERKRRDKQYIVDFAFKHSMFGTNNIIIVEIDGQTHYADYDKSNKKYTISEKIYAQHLKKDRLLRKDGFQVFRIGNYEIDRIMELPNDKERLYKFEAFFNEVFGTEIFIER